MLLKEKFPIGYRFADYHRIVFDASNIAITQSNQEFLKSAYDYYDKRNKKS